MFKHDAWQERSHGKWSRGLGVFAGVLLLSLQSTPSHALNFNPTDAEWATWGDMCRSRYVVSAAGRGSRFANRIANSDVESWRSQVPGAWGSLHHYCAAKVVLSRAQAALTEQQKQHHLRRVLSEVAFSKARTPTTEITYADYLVLEAQAHNALNDPTAALGSLAKAKSYHPNYGPPYSLEAIIRRKSGDLDGAKQVLDIALAKDVSGLSEIHYLMAIVYRDKKQYETALTHAEKAEALGYPMTRLRYSLARKIADQNKTASN
ncbi:MAG: hypothetical protein AAF290_06965 [Pseudomonadota bacterium]